MALSGTLPRRSLLAGIAGAATGAVLATGSAGAAQGRARRTALIVVDVQVDFCEGGSLGVDGGAAVARRISRWLSRHRHHYALTVATRDWHIDPGDHFSDSPDYVNSWPVHCVARSPGAAFHPDLDSHVDFTKTVDEVVSKGQFSGAYSGFEGTTGDGGTLVQLLQAKRIDRIHVVGIATDFCVSATVHDALDLGYPVRVLAPMCAGVSVNGSAAALRRMARAGARITSDLSKVTQSLRA